MSYQVIARKWRPKTFDEVVGQNHIVQTLKNAIGINRIAHAYLFAGSRGVGKTSTARIFARAINCKAGPAPNPCNACEHCLEILAARSLDVIEIDGASNTGVDDVRELRENVKYAPAKTKFKIYIIDEVHMLSKAAFNALLKTLEEPPPHLVFLFATTELNKIPETILSRCQYFEFKRIGSGDIVRQLDLIARSEGIGISAGSLKAIARAAEGSLRDAESLLDQVLSYAGGEISDDQVASILGMVGEDVIRNFADRIIDRDTAGLLDLYQEILTKGQDIKLLCRELQEYFRNLAIAKASAQPESLLDISGENITVLKAQAQRIGMEEIQYLFNSLLKIEYDLKNSSVPTLVLEMALIRMSRYQPMKLLSEIMERLSALQKGLPPASGGDVPSSKKKSEEGSLPLPKEKPENPQRDRPENSIAAPSPPQEIAEGTDAWGRIAEEVVKKKSVLKFMLAGAELIQLDNAALRIGVRDKISLERLKTPENIGVIQDAAREVLGAARKFFVDLLDGDEPGSAPSEGSAAQRVSAELPQAAAPEPETSTIPKIVEEAAEIFGGTILKK